MKTTGRCFLLFIAAALLLASQSTPAEADESACALYVLKQQGDDVAVERIELGDGEERSLRSGQVLTFILPMGTGQSGDLIQQSGQKGTIVAKCSDGILHVSVQMPDGRTREMPELDATELSKYDVRVNVTGGDGFKKAFVVRAYSEVEVDDGPVVDMFQGMVPLAPGDFAVTTEVSQHKARKSVSGTAVISVVDEMLVVETVVHRKSVGRFIIDFGAGSTVVSKDIIPVGVDIYEMTAVEYTEEGAKESAGEMNAAGGSVSGFLGTASLGELSFGNIKLHGVSVNVIEKMPKFGDLDVVGILGLDILRRAGAVSIGFETGMGGTMTFLPPSEPVATGATLQMAFKWAAKHIFIDGTLDGKPVNVAFDTGARRSIIAEGAATRSDLVLDPNDTREFRGLDGMPFMAHATTVADFRLGANKLPPTKFYVARLAVFDTMGLTDDGVLLGLDFVRGYKTMEVDFKRERIRFWK